jgi:hypothetical protein
MNPRTPATTTEALAVALDHAEETTLYPQQLRQRIANLLPALQIAGPWVRDEEQLLLQIFPALGQDAIATVWASPEDWANDDDLGTWVLRLAHGEVPCASRVRAQELVVGALEEAGWVLAASPIAPLCTYRVRQEPCSACEGEGEIGGCPQCGAVQEVPAFDPDERPGRCDYCGGTGRHDPLLAARCPRCGGSGRMS